MKLSSEQESNLALFQKHVEAELAGDLETTMATMTENPHLINVPSKFGAWVEKAFVYFIKII